MKRFLWGIPLVFVLISLRANADTISTIFLSPNDGSGDNFAYLLQSPSLNIQVYGGIPFDFFNAFGYAPGSTLGGSTDVFFSDGSINGHGLDFTALGTLFMSSITLPTNGTATLTTQVILDFSARAINVDTGQPVSIDASETGTAAFTLYNGIYSAQRITATSTISTVPEPGAFGLVGTGILSLLAAFRKSFRV